MARRAPVGWKGRAARSQASLLCIGGPSEQKERICVVRLAKYFKRPKLCAFVDVSSASHAARLGGPAGSRRAVPGTSSGASGCADSLLGVPPVVEIPLRFANLLDVVAGVEAVVHAVAQCARRPRRSGPQRRLATARRAVGRALRPRLQVVAATLRPLGDRSELGTTIYSARRFRVARSTKIHELRTSSASGYPAYRVFAAELGLRMDGRVLSFEVLRRPAVRLEQYDTIDCPTLKKLREHPPHQRRDGASGGPSVRDYASELNR